MDGIYCILMPVWGLLMIASGVDYGVSVETIETKCGLRRKSRLLLAAIFFGWAWPVAAVLAAAWWVAKGSMRTIRDALPEPRPTPKPLPCAEPGTLALAEDDQRGAVSMLPPPPAPRVRGAQ